MKNQIIVILLFLASNVYSQNPWELKNYKFANPIGLIFNKHSENLTFEDSCVIKNFAIYLTDSINSLSRICFFIQVECVKEEIDSNGLINFKRVSNIRNYLSKTLLELDPKIIYNLKIFSTVYTDDENCQEYKNGNIFANINILLLEGFDFKKVYKNR